MKYTTEKHIAVRSSKFQTYEMFKTKLEKIGFKYLDLRSFNVNSMNDNNCLYINNKWENSNFIAFRFSNTYGLTYDIDDPETFRNALKACYRYYGIYNKIEITLNEIAEWKNINKDSIVIVNQDKN